MMTTTITDLIRALEVTKTMTLAVDQEDASGEIETKKIDLEQILNLFAVIGNEPPTGVAHAWTTDAIPTGYLELNGQTFDPNAYPQLGLIFPSGILPDWRGRVAKHTPNESNAGTTEEDEIKAHSHTITIDSIDLGGKSTSSDTHNHSRGDMDITGDVDFRGVQASDLVTSASGAFSKGGANVGLLPQTLNYYDPNSAANFVFSAANSWTGVTSPHSHSHSIELGPHNHTASCSSAGGSENKVKGVFVRYIVRAR